MTRPARSRSGLALVSVGVLVLLVAVVATGTVLVRGGAPPRADAVSTGAVPAAAAASAPARPGVAASPVTPPLRGPGVPASLAITDLGVRGAGVVPVIAQPTGALDIPDDPQQVGWYAAGAVPGSPTGTVVLAGHVDSAELGLGVLAPVGTLRPGAEVEVTSSTGTVSSWQVQAVRQYPKSALPRDIFTRFGPSRLALVTCGGAFDRATGHYEDNVVVYAVPAAA